MSGSPKYVTNADWDTAYREGTPPWDTGVPHAELVRVLDEYDLRPQTVLDIGCGTGADAILLARRRFEVTAVDCSPIALERARLRRAAKRPGAFRGGGRVRVRPLGRTVRSRT